MFLENDIKSPDGTSLHFVYRSEWLAQPPTAKLNDLELPSQRIIIAHTATENCTNQVISWTIVFINESPKLLIIIS